MKLWILRNNLLFKKIKFYRFIILILHYYNNNYDVIMLLYWYLRTICWSNTIMVRIISNNQIWYDSIIIMGSRCNLSSYLPPSLLFNNNNNNITTPAIANFDWCGLSATKLTKKKNSRQYIIMLISCYK